MSSFALFMIGFVILIAGGAYGAFLAGLSGKWILVGAVMLLGVGVLVGVVTMRRRDGPSQ